MKDRRTYAEKLRDPEWQKRRQEIIEKSNHECSSCGESGVTLQVHHGFYARGAMPWEYEDKYLHALCKPCHKQSEDQREQLYRLVAQVCPNALDTLLGYAMAVVANQTGDATALEAAQGSYEMQEAVGDYFGLSQADTGILPRHGAFSEESMAALMARKWQKQRREDKDVPSGA